jgi:hypothetical protein
MEIAMRTLLVALLVVLGWQSLANADTLEPRALWTNQRGSVLQITSVGQGVFRGIFTNRADGFACQGTPYPVSGTTFGVQIRFTVNFAKCGTVAKWQGNYMGFGMSTQWVLTSVKNGVSTNMVGYDFFGFSGYAPK